MLLRDLIRRISNELSRGGIATPLLDAEILVSHALGTDRYGIITVPDRDVPAAIESKAGELAGRRLDGEPVAYIIGSKEFYSLDFQVDPRVLIPRPETELLVDLAIYYAPRDGTLLDIGTGSGAIAVAVKHNRGDLSVTATDLSADALEVAAANADGILGPGSVDLRLGDLYGPVRGMRFDVILSNPPYVSPGERDALEKEVLREPGVALFAEDDGRAVIKRIVIEAGEYLNPGGIVIVEIGDRMRAFMMGCAADAGFTVSVMNDYAGLARVAVLKNAPRRV